MSDDRIRIFDTTLRDGEQSPGCSMNLSEKLVLARQLAKLGVDVIEAGFAIASEGDFEAVKAIAGELSDVTVASLARTSREDVDKAARALERAGTRGEDRRRGMVELVRVLHRFRELRRARPRARRGRRQVEARPRRDLFALLDDRCVGRVFVGEHREAEVARGWMRVDRHASDHARAKLTGALV